MSGGHGDQNAGPDPAAADRGYGRAIVIAAAQQAVVFLPASLLLDQGRVLRICIVAATVSWGCTLLVMLRRPRQPGQVDLVIVQYGFWFSAALVAAMSIIFGFV